MFLTLDYIYIFQFFIAFNIDLYFIFKLVFDNESLVVTLSQHLKPWNIAFSLLLEEKMI